MRPTVLFASAQTFEAGDQLAAALRRSGIQVELYRPPAVGGFARILLRASRLVYTRIHESSAQTGADSISVRELAARAAEPDVVSVEATDETVAPLIQFLTGSSSTDRSPAQEAGRVLPKVCSSNHPAGMFDKRWQATAASEAGLTAPKTWSDLADVDTFPILVKPILGGGGEGIKLARSRVDLDEIIAAQAPTDEPTRSSFLLMSASPTRILRSARSGRFACWIFQMKSRPWPPYWQTPATPAPSAST